MSNPDVPQKAPYPVEVEAGKDVDKVIIRVD